MDIDIIKQTENPLLGRTEVEFKIVHDQAATPSRDTVASKLAAILNADRDRTVVKKVRSEFGLNSSIGYANVYDTAEAISIEPNFILKRNGIGGSEE